MQQRLFVPEHGYHQIARHAEVWEHVVAPHGLLFDPAAMRGLIAAELARLPKDKVPVISSEILSGHPFFGGIGSDVYADRLKAIAPDARILISIRSQMRILTSVYMQYLLRGGPVGYKTFFKGDPELGFYGFRPEHFEYDRLVAYYQKLFGAENVHVITQESLKSDMDGATRRLAGFCGNRGFDGVLKTHRAAYAPSYPEYAVPLLRRINKFQTSVLTPAPTIRFGTTPFGLYRAAGYLLRRPPFSWILGGYHPVTAHVQRTFAGRFDDSNRRLADLAPYLDLAEYGQKGTPAPADLRLAAPKPAVAAQ